MASIHRRNRASKDGKPQYSYIVMWEDPSGKQTSKTFRLLRDAKAFKAEVERSMNRNAYVDPHAGKVPLREYALRWLTSKETSRRAGTVRTYRSTLESRILPALGDMPIHSIHRSNIQDLIDSLKGTLEPRTVRLTYTIIATVFRRALNDEIIGRTPCRDIELPAIEEKDVVPLTVEQVESLASVIDPRFRAMVIAAAGTGLRWSELAGLTVDRVDFLRRTLRVDRQLKRDSAEFEVPKTSKSIRTIPVPQYVIEELAAHLAEYGKGPHGLIFHTASNTALRYGNFRRRVWYPAVERAEDVPDDTTFHGLRHTYASLLIAGGLSPKVIQVRLGHDSITTTMDTYGHLYPESDDATRAAIDDVFRPEVDDKLTDGNEASAA